MKRAAWIVVAALVAWLVVNAVKAGSAVDAAQSKRAQALEAALGN